MNQITLVLSKMAVGEKLFLDTYEWSVSADSLVAKPQVASTATCTLMWLSQAWSTNIDGTETYIPFFSVMTDEMELSMLMPQTVWKLQSLCNICYLNDMITNEKKNTEVVFMLDPLTNTDI